MNVQVKENEKIKMSVARRDWALEWPKLRSDALLPRDARDMLVQIFRVFCICEREVKVPGVSR